MGVAFGSVTDAEKIDNDPAAICRTIFSVGLWQRPSEGGAGCLASLSAPDYLAADASWTTRPTARLVLSLGSH